MTVEDQTPRPPNVAGGLFMLLGVLLIAVGVHRLIMPDGTIPGTDIDLPAIDDIDLGSVNLGEIDPPFWDWLGSDEDSSSETVISPTEADSETGTETAEEATLVVAAAEPPDAPTPVAVRIPTIEVAADMIPLGIRTDGSIEVPEDFAQTGWWVDGPEPGEIGPAVVLGHVDSRSGPAVFFNLTQLQPGDEIVIDRVDGSSVAYRVDRIEQHPKNDFPTDAVYGDTPDAQLRLVTCGGDFDRSIRSYDDNVIVFASLV